MLKWLKRKHAAVEVIAEELGAGANLLRLGENCSACSVSSTVWLSFVEKQPILVNPNQRS